MSVERFNGLKDRLDSLKQGRPPPVGLLERATRFFAQRTGTGAVKSLRALDADLERAGIHTVADARLLQELGAATGRLGTLSQGLRDRAAASLDEFETRLEDAERLAYFGELSAALRSEIDRDFDRLSRIVKVAAVFSTRVAVQAPFEIFPPIKSAPPPPPHSARIALAEFLSLRAQGELADLTRKRRDLDLAYEIVLRMGADGKNDRDRLRRLRLELGGARERVRSSPSVRSFDELFRHVRHSARRDPASAWRSLRSLYDRAVEAGQPELADRAHQAAMSLTREDDVVHGAARAASVRAVGWRDQFAADALAPGGKKGLDDALASQLAALAFDLDDDRRRALELAAGCARFFDVEDALGEEIVEAKTSSTRPKQRHVPYPTQLMTYEPTNSLDQLNHFVLDHPGSLILDLAAGRQMVRSYLEEAPPPSAKKTQKTAVRVYVLDASGSMHGARSRFRDAILISELNAVRVKAAAKLPFDPLYFSFFNDSPTELVRIDSGDAASRHIEKLFRTSPAEGQTDISLALISAFESIARARGQDPYLARATVVLVTDGEDGVDVDLINRSRKPVQGVEMSFSFISLGEENPDLRSIVLEQRNQGGRAFYHHLSDAEIELAPTEFDSAWRTLLPADVAVTTESLEKLLPHLDALEQIARNLAVDRPVSSDAQFDTLFPETHPLERAAPNQLPRLLDVLEAVGEAVGLSPADARRAEAVALLTHLLQVYAIPLPSYLEWVQTNEPKLEKAVARIRLVC